MHTYVYIYVYIVDWALSCFWKVQAYGVHLSTIAAVTREFHVSETNLLGPQLHVLLHPHFGLIWPRFSRTPLGIDFQYNRCILIYDFDVSLYLHEMCI